MLPEDAPHRSKGTASACVRGRNTPGEAIAVDPGGLFFGLGFHLGQEVKNKGIGIFFFRLQVNLGRFF